MRIGRNPLTNAQAPAQIGEIVLAVVTHLPSTNDAYHAQRMEVVQACFESMLAGVKKEHTLIVWDNGSGPELRTWLRDELQPDVLVESVNIGKDYARTALLRMLPPGTIVAYSDDDIFFYDNWLQPQIELLEHFPNVAAVSGNPIRTSFRWGCDRTKEWARANGKLKVGLFIPREWEDDFAVSIGRDPEYHKVYSEDTTDAIVTYNGKSAYCTAHHCQVVGYSHILGSVPRYDHHAMGEERTFDIALDTIGLRLSTTQRYARHIGNVMDDRLRAELAELREKEYVPVQGAKP